MSSVYWIGDPTVQYNDITPWPQRGMGQELALCLKPGTAVNNHARNGRRTKSFWEDGLFAPVYAALAPGDLLLIQFGHNDKKRDRPELYVTTDQYCAATPPWQRSGARCPS